MLALASLELARAKRHREPLLSCRTNSLQIAMASIQAAILEKKPVLITVDATIATTVPHQAMLAALLEVGRAAPVQVIIEVVVPATKEGASWWVDRGVLAVTLSGGIDAIKRNLSHVASEAYSHGAEVGFEPLDLSSIAQAEKMNHGMDASFIRLNPRSTITEMHEYIKALELPVIAGSMHLSPKKSRDLVHAGCVGLTIGEELEEAFTAGVRTALRSRSISDPAKYLGYGAAAVRELVRAHYHYFTSHNKR